MKGTKALLAWLKNLASRANKLLLATIITAVLAGGVVPGLTALGPSPVGATPEAPGYVPESVGDFPELRSACNSWEIAKMLFEVFPPTTLAGAAIGAGQYACNQLADHAQQDAQAAYRRSESIGLSPGFPINTFHGWKPADQRNILIQDFQGGTTGDGAIIQGGDTHPEYVGGPFWAAYKEAVNGYGVSPGHPINTIHPWGDVLIQDFRDGSWGDGAIINTGDGCRLVAGNHWLGYVLAHGEHRLGAPTSFVFQGNDGWWGQGFSNGIIYNRGHDIEVHYSDTNEWLFFRV